MTTEELLCELDLQRALMIEVSTGRSRIQDVNDKYKKRRRTIARELARRGLDDPNPFADLWKWYGKWKADLSGYQSRREFVVNLYQPLLDQLAIGAPASARVFGKALLKAPDQSTSAGRRDHALLALMFNTGARVQELLNLRLCDVRLQPPHQVRLAGKGNRARICPIWPQTAKLLRQLKEERHGVDDATAPLFVNRRGGQLTRYGVRYLLRGYLALAGADVSTITGKRIHPHSLRHTTAIHLLKAGVDFATISQWLGHANLTTTMRYARADVDMKRQALLQVFPDVLATASGDRRTFARLPITEWMKRI